MLRALLITSILIWSAGAQARTAPSPDIRVVQTDSTDIFDVISKLQIAQSALKHRQYIEARRNFETVLMHDPGLEAAREGLRRTLIAMDDIETARLLISDPLSPDGVIIRIRAGEVTEPETLLTDTLRRHPDPRLWTLLGHIQDLKGKYASARQSYAMAELAGARPGLADNNIGQSHWLAGEFESALQAFTRATQKDSTDTQFDNNRRRALLHLGETHAAISGLDSTRAGLFLIKAGDRAALEGEDKLAKVLYGKALKIAPRHNPQVVAKLAKLDQ